MTTGLARGYFPEPVKSIHVVKPAMIERSKAHFNHIVLEVTTGTRYLGGFVGTTADESSHIRKKVSKWSTGITRLSVVAHSSSQAAFYFFQQLYQHEWKYLQHVVSNVAKHFALIETAIRTIFLPALLGGTATTTITPDLHALLSLPIKLAGIGVPNPTKSAGENHTTSSVCTSVLTDSLLNGTFLVITDHQAAMRERGVPHNPPSAPMLPLHCPPSLT